MFSIPLLLLLPSPPFSSMPKKVATKKDPAPATASGVSTRGKRKGASAEEPAPKRKKGDPIGEMFAAYKDPTEDRIGPDGVESLCKDLNIAPDSMTALILAWKLGAEEMGYFTKDEFTNGIQNLGVNDISSLRTTLLSIEDKTKYTTPEFTELYKFAFGFCCDKNNKKSVDIETAATMVELVLSKGPHTKKFVDFLKQNKTYKVINKDQWLCFLEFSKMIKPDFSNHDGSEASWPLLIDEYVEYAGH